MDPLSPVSSTSATEPGANIFAANGSRFSENPFLQVLIQQLRSQTPLEPVDNSAMMQQMGALNTMEEQRQLNDNMLKLLSYQGTLARLQGLSEGSALLGKEIRWTDADGIEQSGIADSVFVDESGEVRVSVGSNEVSLTQITSISAP